ncbi:MAG: hypothetical protein JRG73_20050 [Deltaproteobacteria bacterium]|nr:hypothetical protein [Deltaproteobacteria bacterium]
MARQCAARQGFFEGTEKTLYVAGLGWARLGMARPGRALQSAARQGFFEGMKKILTWRGSARLGAARQSSAGFGTARRGKAGRCNARQGKVF